MDDSYDAPHDPSGDLVWRETYVVLLESSDRPTLNQVEGAIADSGKRLSIENLRANDDGLFSSVLVQAPEDNAALDIRYESGEPIRERAITLSQQLRGELKGERLAKLLSCDAWLEVMHFEKMAPADEWADDEPDDLLGPEGLDPATLITVVEALAHLTDGLPIDPTAGALLS
ncbi:hypothetical protein [Botrimarina sp.]|uniref:hypothetical protein n=1 Tax=Botrimarina sp. TaxID=2795802 RepID=UPI0032EB338E